MSDELDALDGMVQGLSSDELRVAMHWLAERCNRLFPAPEQSALREGAAAVALAEVLGMRVAALPEIVAAGKQALMIEQEGSPAYVIGSVRGLVNVAQLGVDDAFIGARLEALERTGRWTCPLCKRRFPDDFEPDCCPDCGARLMRVRAATPAEREQLMREQQ